MTDVSATQTTDTAAVPAEGLQLRSTVTTDGHLHLSLVSVPTPSPRPDDVVVRIEAAPINPSDLGLLLAAADLATATGTGTGTDAAVTAMIPDSVMAGLSGRLDQSMPVGNEGGGIVVGAGSSPAAQALIGRTVGLLGGATYSQYRCVNINQCLPLPDGVTPMEGASCFVNPLTALGMLETMRREGH